jgi:hypothetical protein
VESIELIVGAIPAPNDQDAFIAMAHLPHLRSLKLSGPIFFEACGGWSPVALEELLLDGGAWFGIHHLFQGLPADATSRLRVLEGTQLSASALGVLGAVQGCPALERLGVGKLIFVHADSSWASLAKMSKLTYLELRMEDVENDPEMALRGLSTLTTLRTLAVAVPIASACLAAFPSLPAIPCGGCNIAHLPIAIALSIAPAVEAMPLLEHVLRSPSDSVTRAAFLAQTATRARPPTHASLRSLV